MSWFECFVWKLFWQPGLGTRFFWYKVNGVLGVEEPEPTAEFDWTLVWAAAGAVGLVAGRLVGDDSVAGGEDDDAVVQGGVEGVGGGGEEDAGSAGGSDGADDV